MRPALFVLLAAFAVAACDTQETSLFNPNAPVGPTPVIETVTSDDPLVLAGIDVVTVSGRNFSAVLAENRVSFDDGAGASAFGTVLEASPTQLRVRVPNLPNPALRIRVAVPMSPDFSNPYALPLLPAFVPFGDISPGDKEVVGGVASDAAGTLYFSLVTDNQPRGIFRFSADGTRSPYFAAPGTNFPWIDLAFNETDDQLYAVRAIQALFRLPQGGVQQTVQPVQPTGTSLLSIDADAQGRIWAAGSRANLATAEIVRFNLDGTASPFPFPRAVRALKVSPTAIYVIANEGSGTDPQSKVVRLPLSASGDISGPGEVLYDISGQLGASIGGSALAIASDGTLFVGTNNRPDPIIEIQLDGTAAPLYPGVIPSPVLGLEWGQGTELYMIRGDDPNTTNTVEPAGIIKIQTRRARPL